MVSSTSAAFDMTLSQSASSTYTLTVMTVVAGLLVPVVLAYQAWTYWVFRKRISGGHIPPASAAGIPSQRKGAQTTTPA
jgi:cytochrome d ubiquinol oxidase subunit II